MTNEVVHLKGEEYSAFLSKLVTKGILALILVFAIGLIQIFRHGGMNYVILMVGALVSGVALLFYALFTPRIAARKERTWWAIPTTVAGMIPYVFGCFLLFYEGFWRLKLLFTDGFSFFVILKAAVFVIAGFAVVNSTYLVSEFVKQTSNGLFSIKS